MNAISLALLNLSDALPGGREVFLEDIKPLVAETLYYSPDRVAERYEVSLSTLKKWRSDGLLSPSMKVPGGTCRYTLKDLIEFETRTGRKEKE